MRPDPPGNIQAPVRGGAFDRKTGKFTRYQHDPSNPHSISHNKVLAIGESSQQNGEILWIGTGNGINMFDRQTEKFTHLQLDPITHQFLTEKLVTTIYEDKTWQKITQKPIGRI